MKLIPEQIYYLRKKERELKESIKGYSDYLRSREITSAATEAIAQVGDPLTDTQYQMERNAYNEITELLANATYVTVRDTESVQIGTKFIVSIDGVGDTKPIILTDKLFGVSSTGEFVSGDSPLGRGVYGKKEGDIVSYVLPGDGPRGRKMTGTVRKIISDPNEYLHFIRERDSKNRMSKPMRAKIHSLLSSGSEEDLAEYESMQEITASQRGLLVLEAERLTRGNLNPVEAKRLTDIKKMIQTRKVARPTGDNGISAGSFVELFITDGTSTTISNFEYINRAVSNELEEEYVERISPLGSKIFGLKPNDTFSFQKGNKTYKGVVAKVSNSSYGEENNMGFAYQKKIK